MNHKAIGILIITLGIGISGGFGLSKLDIGFLKSDASGGRNASCISINAPTSVTAGSAISASVVMKNTGTVNWVSPNYKLGDWNSALSPYVKKWGTARVAIPSSPILPNETTTFTFSATAPTTPGTYVFDWKMLEEKKEWFGSTCSKTIVVTSDLSSIIGVTHLAGTYPDKGVDFLRYGAQEAIDLGFKNIEISLAPATCRTDATHPKGQYQTLQDCPITSMVTLAQTPRYQQVFKMPFNTYFIDAETTQYNAAVHRITGAVFTQQQLDLLYQDFLSLGQYLLNTYRNTNKTFVILTPNQMDWHMIAPSKDRSTNPTDQTVNNAIAYWNTIQNALDQAKAESDAQGVKLYHACEATFANKSMQGGKTATNYVVPFTHCDLYGYSDHSTFSEPPLFSQAFNYLKEKAPDSKAFGSNNVMLSELGAPGLWRVFSSEAQAASTLDELIKIAINFGAPYINYWQIYDNECTIDGKCVGYWIRKPDGSLSVNYTQVLSKYLPRVSLTPTATTFPTPKSTPKTTPIPTPTSWQFIDANSFTLSLPLEWKFNKLQGMDSYIGEFVGGGTRLFFDFGWYSSPGEESTDPRYVVTYETIDGYRAKIVVPKVTGNGATGIYFADLGNQNRFSLSGNNLTSSQQEIALKIFQTIKFKK